MKNDSVKSVRRGVPNGKGPLSKSGGWKKPCGFKSRPLRLSSPKRRATADKVRWSEPRRRDSPKNLCGMLNILNCKNNRQYTGCTDDLKNRLKKHKKGRTFLIRETYV